jgi:hypothetical protein
VYLSASLSIEHYELYDAQGTLVQQKTITKEQTVISVSHLNAGIYLLKIYSGNTAYVRKIQIIQ